MKNGQTAILVLNKNDVNKKFVLKTNEFGIPKKAIIGDVYEKRKVSAKKEKIEIDLKPHACQFMLASDKK